MHYLCNCKKIIMKGIYFGLAVFFTLVVILNCFVLIAISNCLAKKGEGEIKYGVIYCWIFLASFCWGMFIAL